MFIGVQCVLESEDAKSIIDTAAEIAAECVNAPNPEKAADEIMSKVKVDEAGIVTFDIGKKINNATTKEAVSAK